VKTPSMAVYLQNTSPGHSKHYFVAVWMDDTMMEAPYYVGTGWGRIGGAPSDEFQKMYTGGKRSGSFKNINHAIAYANAIICGKTGRDGYHIAWDVAADAAMPEAPYRKAMAGDTEFGPAWFDEAARQLLRTGSATAASVASAAAPPTAPAGASSHPWSRRRSKAEVEAALERKAKEAKEKREAKARVAASAAVGATAGWAVAEADIERMLNENESAAEDEKKVEEEKRNDSSIKPRFGWRKRQP
jgi:hypothetical protein